MGPDVDGGGQPDNSTLGLNLDLIALDFAPTKKPISIFNRFSVVSVLPRIVSLIFEPTGLGKGVEA